MEADPSQALVGHLPPPPPARHLELADLPPAVAERLRFDRAAPRRLRGDQLPAAVRAELAQLWDGVVADVYDEVTGLRRHRALRSGTVERRPARVSATACCRPSG